MFNLFSDNKIIIHGQNGKTRRVFSVPGLHIRFSGKNSVVEIFEPFNLARHFGKKSVIRIDGDNNHLIFKATKYRINLIKIIDIADNNKIVIGENLFQTGSLRVDFAGQSNKELIIGNDCMFGQNVQIMLGDFHKIIDIKMGKQTNIPKYGVKIGNHVWLARDVKILKDTKIADNSIVATGSIVSKEFERQNVLIGGAPAKIIKEDVTWEI